MNRRLALSSALFVSLMGAVIYLAALDFEMTLALHYGAVTLVPDALLPLEAFFVVPFLIGTTGVGAGLFLREVGNLSKKERRGDYPLKEGDPAQP